MKNLKTLRNAVPLAALACAIAFFSSGCSQSIAPIRGINFSYSVPYPDTGSLFTEWGPIHNAGCRYIISHLDSATVTGPQAVLLDSITSKLEEFMMDSTNIDTTGYYDLRPELDQVANNVSQGNYSNATWVHQQFATDAENYEGVADYTSNDSIFLQSIASASMISDSTYRTNQLNSLYATWQGDSVADVSGTPVDSEYWITGGPLSVGYYSSRLWPSDTIPLVTADVAGALGGAAGSVASDLVGGKKPDLGKAVKTGIATGIGATVTAAVLTFGLSLIL